MSKDFFEAFLTSMDSLQQFLSHDSSQVIRLLFSDEKGKLKSITTLSSKIKPLNLRDSLDLKKILDILTLDEKKVLLPDLKTGFSDPCSVQQTYCILCSILSENFTPQDDRSHLYKFYSEGKLYLALSFNLATDDEANSELDIFHDLRSEILLEGFKAGVEVNSHYTNEKNLCTIELTADNVLAFADSLQKIKFIVNNIAASYGKLASFGEAVLTTEDKNLKKKVMRMDEDFEIKNNLLKITLKTLDMNPYSFMKNLFI